MFIRVRMEGQESCEHGLMAAPAVRATPVKPAATDHSSGRTIVPKCVEWIASSVRRL